MKIGMCDICMSMAMRPKVKLITNSHGLISVCISANLHNCNAICFNRNLKTTSHRFKPSECDPRIQ